MRTSRPGLLLAPSLLALPLVAACASDTVDRDVATLSAAGISVLLVRDIPGDLLVKGQDGRDDLEAIVRLKEWSTDDDTGDTALDTAFERPELDVEDQFEIALTNIGGGVAELSLLTALDLSEYQVKAKVRIPSNLKVVASQIGDDITLRNVGGVEILDDRGRVEVHGARGRVEISDGPGALVVTDVVGEVDIVDAWGRVVVKDVEGDVTIRDGVGGIKVRRVSGKVTIWDTAGNQNIENVGETEIHNSQD